jgi:hypothetical protein
VNAPPGMSCESCRDQLIELVCEELPSERAGEVRAHALRCERCGPELERLSATLRVSRELPLLSPSPEVERRVMQAARDAIARRARGPAREEPVPASSGGLTAWFARLGSFAMSPQVAMASVLLLVVGIGLYALPLGHQTEPTALRAAEDEAAPEEHASAEPAAAATAVPLAEEEKPGGGRVPAEALASSGGKRGTGAAADKTEAAKNGLRGQPSLERREVSSDDALKSAKSAPRPFPESKLEVESQRAAKPKAPSKALGDDFEAFGGAAQEQAVPQPSVRTAEPAPAQSRSASASEGAKAAADRPALGAASGAFAPAPPSAPAPAAARAPVARAQPEAAYDRSDAVAESAAPKSVKKESAAKGDGAATPLSKGIAAIQRGEHALGESLLLPVLQSGTTSERDQARLWLARSLRQRGDCARALEYYRPLTQPVTASRAVLQEAADCQERTGNASAAAKLRSRAALPTKE